MKKLFFTSLFIYVISVFSAQTYQSSFDKLEQAIGPNGASYLINSGAHQLQINEPSYLTSYLDMFLATGDKKYLDKFIIHTKRVQNRRDDDAFLYNGVLSNEIANVSTCTGLSPVPNSLGMGSKTWSSDMGEGSCDCEGWQARLLYTGVITFPMAKFIYIMKTDQRAISILNDILPSEVYQSAATGSSCYTTLNTYNDFTNWLRCRVNESIIFHDGNWCAGIGKYNKLRNPTGDPCDEDFKITYGTCEVSNAVDVLNMQCAMGKTLIMMRQVESIYGNYFLSNDYQNKADAIGYVVNQSMITNNGSYTWCHDFDCEFIEDINHANLIMSFADLYYIHNIGSQIDVYFMNSLGQTLSEKLYEKPLVANSNTFGTNTGNQPLQTNSFPNNSHLLGYYGFMTPYNHYAYQIINDLFSGGATGSCSLSEYDQLSAMNAYSSLALNQKVFNPIAVMRNNQSNKQWSGAAGGDFDGNGIEEIVTYNKSDGELQVYDLNSNKTITPSQIAHNEGNQIADIGAGDLWSGHPGDEVVTVSSNGQIIAQQAIGLFSSTPNTFFPIGSYQLPSNSGNPYVGIEVGDVLPNVPGNEIIVATAHGAPYILSYNQTTNTINLLGQQINSISGTIPTNNITVGDFDPSNPGDEVCIALLPGIYLYRFTSNLAGFQIATYSTGQTININNPWEAVTSGDYDGDGIDEIIVTKHDDGKATMLKYKNNALVEVTNEYFKPDQLISTAASFRKNGKDVIALLRDYDGQIAMFDMEGLCPSLYLSNQTINNSSSLDNIYTNAQNNYPIDYHANNILAVSNFNIAQNGTTAIFTAGKEIAITEEFSSESGTELSAYIDGNLACTTTAFRKGKTNDNEQTNIEKRSTLESLNVFPNPTNGKTQVKYNVLEKTDLTITVLNISGQSIYSKNLTAELGNNNFEIDLSDLNNGVYFFTIDNTVTKKRETGKIVVIK